MDNAERDQSPFRWPKTRVEAISDGVFAIAITLLVIDIKISPSEYADLGHALVHEWPGYLAYVTSFLTIGGVWIAHHSLFTRVEFVDESMLLTNLILLMAVAFLPFPTGVLAQALNSPAEAQHAAIIFYGATVIAVELLLGVLGSEADSRSGAPIERERELIHRYTHLRRRRVTASTIAYAVAIVVGLAVPDLAGGRVSRDLDRGLGGFGQRSQRAYLTDRRSDLRAAAIGLRRPPRKRSQSPTGRLKNRAPSVTVVTVCSVLSCSVVSVAVTSSQPSSLSLARASSSSS